MMERRPVGDSVGRGQVGNNAEGMDAVGPLDACLEGQDQIEPTSKAKHPAFVAQACQQLVDAVPRPANGPLSVVGGKDLLVLRGQGEKQAGLGIPQRSYIAIAHNTPFRVLL